MGNNYGSYKGLRTILDARMARNGSAESAILTENGAAQAGKDGLASTEVVKLRRSGTAGAAARQRSIKKATAVGRLS
jgi:hypothetical protein